MSTPHQHWQHNTAQAQAQPSQVPSYWFRNRYDFSLISPASYINFKEDLFFIIAHVSRDSGAANEVPGKQRQDKTRPRQGTSGRVNRVLGTEYSLADVSEAKGLQLLPGPGTRDRNWEVGYENRKIRFTLYN